MACFVLKKDAFNKLLGPIEEVWKLEALRKVPILFNLAEDKLQELAKRMTTVSVKAQDIVFKAGDQGIPISLTVCPNLHNRIVWNAKHTT